MSIGTAAAAIFVACWLILSGGENGELNGKIAGQGSTDPSGAGPEEVLPPEFAWLDKSQLAEKAVLLEEMERLFEDRLRWIAETDGRVLLEVQNDDTGDGKEHPSVPMAARVVVVRWSEEQTRWTPVWAVDVLVRQEQVVRLSLDEPSTPEGAELALWAFPVDEQTIAVDSTLSLAELTLESSFSGIQESGVPTAIFPFQERGSDVADLGPQVSDLLFAKLVVDPKVYLVEREDLEKIQEEMELNLSGLANPTQSTRVGQLTGAKILLTGSVLQVDSKLYLVAKIIGTETSRVFGASVKGNVGDDLDIMVEQLAEQVAKTIANRAEDLVAKQVSREDRLATLRKALGKAKRPTVKIAIKERHVAGAAIDPAAETEITLFCKELGFDVIDSQEDDDRDADILLVGEGFSEFAARHGNLISVKARLELKAVESDTGRVLAIDRQVAVEVDLTEQLAGKTALQNAAADIAQRLLPKIVSTGGKKD